MNKFQRFWVFIINRYFYWLNPDPSPKTINITGIINSDYPVENNGWIKGWVVNTPSRNVIIVCKHSGPSANLPNNKVFVKDKFGKKIERTIISVDNTKFKLDGKNDIIKFRGVDDYYLGSDISICKVNEPFPDSIETYDISTSPKVLRKKAITFNQKGEPTVAQVNYSNDLAWIIGRKRENGMSLVAGDSGTPWFVWEDKRWKVVTHTTKGYWGEGPYYGHPLIYKELKDRINNI